MRLPEARVCVVIPTLSHLALILGVIMFVSSITVETQRDYERVRKSYFLWKHVQCSSSGLN